MKKISLSEIRRNDLKSIEIQGSLLAKELRVKDTGIDSKTFHYWKIHGLVGIVDKGKWARISFVEYVWLKVLESMREFGCSLKLMRRIFEDQFIKAYDDNLFERTLTDNVAYYYNLSKIRSLAPEEMQILELNKQTLNDPLLMMALRTEISYFYQMVLTSINNGVETGFIIYGDDTYAVMDGSENSIDFNKPYLFIPLSHFIAEILYEEEKEKFIEKTGLLNEQEIWILKELRNKNIEKLTITLDAKNGKVTKVEYDRTGLIEGSKAKEIMQKLGMQNYSSIKLSTRSGTTMTYNKTEKRFFK